MMIEIKYNSDGLVPAVVQDFETKQVLMVAYMNEETLRMTFEKGEMHYWSRSRQEVWHKGATSGHFQVVKEARVDCDSDCLLFLVEQKGAACHTGYKTCFFRSLNQSLEAETVEEHPEETPAGETRG